jgi:membrane dipeptidase
MTWRSRASLTPDEARELHERSLVIDTLAGVGPDIFSTSALQSRFDELVKTKGIDCGVIGQEMGALAWKALRETDEARSAFKEAWRKSGVDVASVTLSGGGAPYQGFDGSLMNISRMLALIHMFRGWLSQALDADDIEKAHREKRPAIMFNFQSTNPFEDKIERVKFFYDLGVRSVMLTSNSTNLVGGGKNDVPIEQLDVMGGGPSDPHVGLTRFGVDVVGALNEVGIIVDVSHSPEKVGFDAVKYSKAPISANHTSSDAVFHNTQAKGDKLLKAIAEKGGFIGIHLVSGYLRAGPRNTLDHVAEHVEHIARVAGIDAIGLGIDMGGYWKLRVPPEVPLPEEKSPPPRSSPRVWQLSEPGTGRCHKVPLDGYKSLEDTPEITVALARRGFNEEELRKFLGLNYIRLMRDISAVAA